MLLNDCVIAFIRNLISLVESGVVTNFGEAFRKLQLLPWVNDL